MILTDSLNISTIFQIYRSQLGIYRLIDKSHQTHPLYCQPITHYTQIMQTKKGHPIIKFR